MSATQARQLMKLGKLAERKMDFEEAKKLYSLALDIDPDASKSDWQLLNGNPKGFPERRAIRALLRTRISEFTKLSYDAWKGAAPEIVEPKMFMYWGQGFDDAPPIVQASLRSAREHHSPEQLILLDDSSVREWVDFPDRIWDIARRHRTAFSDLLRIELLANHGGIWADATCYSTGNLVERYNEMTDPSGFFAFPQTSRGVISSWFMASKANSYISRMMRDSMRLYWSVYDRPITYYYMHQIWLQLYRMDDRFRAQADRIPDLGVNPRAINRAMLLDVDSVDIEALLAGSFVHKLTYKNPKELVTHSTVAAHMALR